jgi:CRP-like cAMP-binding protein
MPLARLGPGEMFGEIALLEPGGKRQATVTATTDLLTLSLSAPAFQRTTAQARRILEWQVSVPQESGVSKFASRSPATLPNSRLLRLTRVRSRERASAAIRRSFGPMGVPARSRSALMMP